MPLTNLEAAVLCREIQEIEDFNKTPCKDPHVDNTSQIGYFEILKVRRTGKNSYRFNFK